MAERALGQTRRGETGAPGLSPDETSRRKVAKILIPRERVRERSLLRSERERGDRITESVCGAGTTQETYHKFALWFFEHAQPQRASSYTSIEQYTLSRSHICISLYP